MRRMLVVVIGVVAAACWWPTAAGAGGWAVTTLDEVPSAPAADEPVPVGYTVRQHGVTPVALEDTAIVVERAGGQTLRFSGAAQGPVGHYVATVVFPEDGTYRWKVDQGWFADQELGTLDVGAAPANAAPTPAGQGSGRWPAPVRIALVAATAASLAVVGATTARWRAERQSASVGA